MIVIAHSIYVDIPTSILDVELSFFVLLWHFSEN